MLTATSSKCMARNKPSLRFSLLVFSVSHSRSPIGAVVLVTWSVRLMLFYETGCSSLGGFDGVCSSCCEVSIPDSAAVLGHWSD